MNTSPSKTQYRAPALEKGLDILELLSVSKKALSLPMIAADLGRSRSEIFRMAAVLESRGYIRRVEDTENFIVTNRLFELGMQNPPTRSLIDIAGPLMHGLAKKVDQSCVLVVASGDQIVVIYSAEAMGYLSFAIRIGHRQALLESTSGQVLLAFQQSDTQEQWLSAELSESRRMYLRKQVTKIQSQGYEATASKTVKGIFDISAPIFDGKSPGAIACLMMPVMEHLKLAEEQRASISAVRETASEISQQLSVGYE